ncbi:hypothetical protein M8J76_016207 [Diaphorina citri]|nr:hypothetical protein M8J76_016207 [Diaphorina citri]
MASRSENTNKTESKSDPKPDTDSPVSQPVSASPTQSSANASTTLPQDTKSYSSRLASYFPGVTTAFTNLTNTLTGATSDPHSNTSASHSTSLGSSSALSAPPTQQSSSFIPPPPTQHSQTSTFIPPPPTQLSQGSTFIPPPPPKTFTPFNPSASPSPVNLPNLSTPNLPSASIASIPPPPPKTSALPGNLPSNLPPASTFSPSSQPTSSDVFSSIPLTPPTQLTSSSSVTFDAFNSVPLTSPLTSSNAFSSVPLTSTSGSSSFFVPSSVAPPAPLVLPSVSSSETPLYAPPSNTTLSPPLFSPASSSTTDGSSYRLRGLKRPTYAPVPGLNTTPVTTPMAPPVTPSTELTDYMTVETPSHPQYTPAQYESPSNQVFSPTLTSQPPGAESAEVYRRYDVHITERERRAVYWTETPSEVRRCSWFYKASLEARYIPYEERVADLLEGEFKAAFTTGQWHKTIPLDNGEEVIMYSVKVIVHHIKPDLRLADFAWDSSSEQSIKPRIVSRGLENFDISEGEPEKIDHLLFLVHGIGSFCDLKFRPVVEVVDDFRSISLTLTASHFKSAADLGTLGRVEMLPISWHEALHSEESGIDKKLKAITLPSIPKLRYFTNDTLLDVLFYTSPVYCERIITAVAKEMNRLYAIFLARNPTYEGGVSVGGHSLGSLILFDLLSHQKPVGGLNSDDVKDSDTDDETLGKSPLLKGNSYISIPTATLGTSAPLIRYHQLSFQPRMFFAFGSPVGKCIRVPATLGTSAPLIRYHQLSFQPRMFFAFGSPVGKCIRVPATLGTSAPLIRYHQLSFQPRMFFAFGSPVGKCIRVPATLGTSAPLIRYHQLSFQPRMFFAFGSPVGKCIRVPATLGTSAPLIRYHQLSFQPRMFFAFGSPVGMFVNVRGIDVLGEEFEFPTCPKFYNIFHPFDPVAYRIEPLIVPAMEHVRPVQVPHHKGRKRMHLELKDTLEYVGSALKQKLYDSMKSTWNKVSYLAMLNKTDDHAASVSQDVTQALEEQLLAESVDAANVFPEPTQDLEPGKTVGKINGGNRVDYVLQEAPLESFNEYLFALSSHVCYWESNDTMLLVLKEIYSDLGVSADNQVPQQILPFDMDEQGGGPMEATSPTEGSRVGVL